MFSWRKNDSLPGLRANVKIYLMCVDYMDSEGEFISRNVCG